MIDRWHHKMDCHITVFVTIRDKLDNRTPCAKVLGQVFPEASVNSLFLPRKEKLVSVAVDIIASNLTKNTEVKTGVRMGKPQ